MNQISIIAYPAIAFLLSVLPMPQSAKPVELPDTVAGRRVAAYIKAFNSGDEELMRDFISNNAAASSLQQRPIDARIEVYRRMRDDIGSIDVRRGAVTRESAIVVLAQSKRGEWLELSFEFESGPPNKLLSLRVEHAEPPSADTERASLPAKMTEAEVIESLDKYLFQAVAADEFSGTVLVAKSGNPIFQKAYGLASKEFNVPNRIDTKFNLGSINKIFTQIAIGQLVDQGKLSFDDKLGKHLPDYPNREAAEKVTIRQMLDMASGIGNFFGPEFEATPKNRLRTIKDFLALFANKPLAFEPGTKKQYSNGGYIVLGAIVEKISGKNYYDYVREQIFKPADMQNTDWYEADAEIANLASGYATDKGSKSVRRSNIYSRPAKGSPAGGGYSTAQDLLKFAGALREGKLRVPDFRNERKASEPGPARFGGIGIAGGAPGINAVLEAGEDGRYTVIVLSNYDPPSAEKIGRQIRGWISRIN